ncbi:Glycoside-Pentoside-Hexuronide (GPH):Cation Symporter Family [Thraustotheca clavata]|uniref:Glycoside-Pentoside-Hexuronide (GPH):Cation Symporter Family n=1 Tax=Thraustotheca clavata TaxID=74557 RepID=A0A1V9ZYV4_9STRA|nr:Glycoside-Pentoside-Hexuronide (GPH):Cation Symporter Family [Thraustotheca clavata]
MSSHLEDQSEGFKAAVTPQVEDDATVAKPIESCSTPFLFLLCCPKMALNVAWAAQWAALGPLLQILIPSSWVQIVQLVGPVSGLLIAPSIGVLSDNCASKLGRRWPFLFWGAVMSCACWAVMMFCTDIGEALGDTPAKDLDRLPVDQVSRKWTTVFVILTYIWMDITLNLTQTPLNLLIADFAGERQVTASSLGNAYSIVGSFVVSGYIMAFGPAHESVKPFMGMLIAVMVICAGAVLIFVKEKRFVPIKEVSTIQEIKNAFASVWTGIRLLPKVLAIYCVIIVLVQYGFTAYNGAKGQYFGLVVKNGDSANADKCGHDGNAPCSEAQNNYNSGVQLAGGVTDTIYNCVSLLFLAGLPYLVRTFGVKKVITVAIIPQAFLIVMAFCKVVVIDMIIVISTAITQNTLQSLFMAAIIHVIGHEENAGLGLFAGALNSAYCCGQFLNFIFSSILVTSSMGYALPVLVGGILSLLGFLVSLIFFKIELYST